MNIEKVKTIATTSTEVSDLETYGRDWSMNFPANPSAVVFPKTEDEVVQLVQWARENKTALVPSGGRTGLSSAATATNKEVVVSFEKMNQILEFNETDQVIRVQPGVITEDLINFAAEKGYFFPIDLAAKGSCQIGGNVATNAGGVRVLKYGMMRNWVSGLKVVTGAGERLYLNKSLVKNATGFDLKNLFVGSEGTLGFITEIELKVTRPQPNTTVLVVGLEKLADVINVYKHFRQGADLSACEVFSNYSMNKVLEVMDLQKPFDSEAAFYLLLELEHLEEDASETIAPLFEYCFEQGWIHDGVISQSPTQAKNLWALRENVSESLSTKSPYRNDVSVRIPNIPAFVEELESAYKKEYPDFEVAWFGHIGDGNLHIDILKPDDMDKTEFIKKCKASDSVLFSVVQKYQGSISAEHGVGLLKKDYLEYSRSPEEIRIMKGIKKVFDPDNILNPGKIFDL
ncbi:MAG: FAD-binding oxidoreductase [Bdellovibrionales bacterium]|nr:FAD-binding oxidoreductase [Bdellovibrionales bacterium]